MQLNFKENYSIIVDSLNKKVYEDLPQNINVIVFGYGTIGKIFVMNAKNFGFNIVAIVDNNIQLQRKSFCAVTGLPIISPEKIKSYTDIYIQLATLDPEFQKEMKEQLLVLGIDENRILCDAGIAMITITITPSKFQEKYLKGYEYAYDLFIDEISKDVLFQRISSYFSSHIFKHSNFGDQYFSSDCISFTDKEVFINAGCYDGKTDKDFISLVSGKYEHIYAFEPDSESYERCKTNLLGIENLSLIKKGLSDKNETLSFDAQGTGSSKIDENATTFIEVVALDNFLKDKHHIPTFIKMDIEGAELAALKGAEQTIRQHKPKLAICVYHKIEDLYEIPQLISSYGDYTFYMRHYTPYQTETVLYAIPK